jgi:hypothetical protein
LALDNFAPALDISRQSDAKRTAGLAKESPPVTTETSSAGSQYPLRLEVRRPESQSRLTNFPLFIGSFIRYILAIPHLIVLYFLGIVAFLIYFVATFAILFTGKFPAGMFKFYIGVERWSTNLAGYLGHLYDDYPPFSMEPQSYPLTYEVDYPESLSRLLNFPFFGILIKAVLLIPHFIVLTFLGIVAWLILFIAQFAILFTGSFPAGMHGFMVGVTRWSSRVNAYLYAMTDKYPPFSMS